MPENFGSVVLEAFLGGQKNKMQREQQVAQNAVQQEKLKLEQQQQTQQAQQFNQQLQSHQNEFRVTQKLREADYEFKVGIAKEAMRRQQIAAGSKGEAKIVRNDDGSFTLDAFNSPQEAGQTKAAIAQPALDAQQEKAVALQNNQAGNQIGLHAVDNTARKEAATQHETFLLALEDKRAANALKVAQIKAAKKAASAAGIEGDISQDLEDIKDGMLTYETIKEAKMSAMEIKRLRLAAQKEGAVILSIQGTKDLNNLGEFGNIYSLAKDYKKALEERRLLDARNIYGTLQSTLGTLAKTVGSEKGALTQRDVERQAQNIPTIEGTLTGQNDARLERLFNFYNVKVSMATKGMSDEQKQRIIEKHGLIRPPLPKGAPTKIPKGVQ